MPMHLIEDTAVCLPHVTHGCPGAHSASCEAELQHAEVEHCHCTKAMPVGGNVCKASSLTGKPWLQARPTNS